MSVDGWFPHINSRGEIVTGSGNVYLHRPGAVPTRLGTGWSPRWLNDDNIIYNGDTRGTIVHEVLTGQERKIAPAYNKIVAGGGYWAGLFQGNPVTLVQNNGSVSIATFAECGLPAMSASGKLIYGTDYHADTHALIVVKPDGTKQQVYVGMVMSASICEGGWAASVYINRDTRRVVYARHGSFAASIGIELWEDPVICDGPNGSLWVLSVTQTGLIFREAGSTMGYRWDGIELLNPDVRLVNGLFVLAASDKVGTHWLRVVDPTVGQVALVPQSVPFDPATVPQLPPLPRKMWVTPFFSHSKRYGDTPLADHVGNAITVVAGDENNLAGSLREELDRIRPLAQPMFVQGNTQVDAVNINQTIAWWVSGKDIEDLRFNVERALAKEEKPVIAYLDQRLWPSARPTWMTDRVWPAVQAYRSPGEVLGTFQATMETTLGRVQAYGQPIVLTPRFDDFNGQGSIQQTLECMPLFDRWLRDYFCVGIMPFSDRRGNGISKSPQLKAWAMAFLNANPARPNRFDYWVPSGSLAAALRNKLQQQTNTIVLMPEEKLYLLGLLLKN
jgi:hypothetical protein